ncbi:ATP-binding cassette domain-containing protein [Dactylosporangium aurantiacum]|uniref:ATP-binding cassette domain-containing protein n=1 Tax=Dactylosporangium aurantiacum TaxID=35754 RepID=UPI001FDEC811|nr:ATP-binding cassette domain-containing protein [Dactylosporangium aurantiacum]
MFGLLGPNGAGKTTTIKMLITLLLPTSGRIEVLGHDVEARPREVRRRVGSVSPTRPCRYGCARSRSCPTWSSASCWSSPASTSRCPTCPAGWPRSRGGCR